METFREKRERIKQEKRNKKEQERKERSQTSVYLSGLPLDVTESELNTLFVKYGLIAEDMYGKPRIKLYKNEDGTIKGDALITYFRPESVDLAIELMDQTNLRNSLITVQEAEFQPKPELKRAEWERKKSKISRLKQSRYL